MNPDTLVGIRHIKNTPIKRSSSIKTDSVAFSHDQNQSITVTAKVTTTATTTATAKTMSTSTAKTMSTSTATPSNKKTGMTRSTSTGSNGGSNGSTGGTGGGRGRTNSLPAHVVDYLKAWILSPQHIHHPYPSEDEKAKIQQDTGIELKKLNNWFVNNRIRFWKPRFEAMQRKQSQTQHHKKQQLREASQPQPQTTSSSTSLQTSAPSRQTTNEARTAMTLKKRHAPQKTSAVVSDKSTSAGSSPSLSSSSSTRTSSTTASSASMRDAPRSPSSSSSTASLLALSSASADMMRPASTKRKLDLSKKTRPHHQRHQEHSNKRAKSAAHLNKVYDVLTLALDDTAHKTATPSVYSRPISDTSASASVASTEASDMEDTSSFQTPRRVSIGPVRTMTPRSKYRRKNEDLWRTACMSGRSGYDDNLPTLDEAALLFGLAEAN